jgi:hypothetical protein
MRAAAGGLQTLAVAARTTGHPLGAADQGRDRRNALVQKQVAQLRLFFRRQPLWREKSAQRFDLLHVQRLPLGMNYVAQAHAINELMQRELLKTARAKLVIDQSGVGAGAVDLMEANELRPIRPQITAGSEQTQEGNIFRVAKTILISKLEAAMHSKELHVAAVLSEADSLRDELRDFQRHVTASGANAWSARAGKHDDIVLAVSYWIWWCTSGPRTVVEPLVI